MTQILSKPAPAFDISSAGFRGAAGDLGEVLAHLAGGLKPDPETLSRLCLSLRVLQGFLLNEAEQQECREVLARAIQSNDHRETMMFPAPTPLSFEGSAPAPVMVVA